jgi:hypothetical protein
MAKANHYVNNAEFLKAIVQYKKDCKEAKRNGKPKPKVPDTIGKALILIAENVAHKPNFNGFTWKEEMIGDGIENCIMYFDNFDPKKSKNPFAYFTQIIYYAFLRRILKEKKQLYVKYKITEQHSIMGDDEGGQGTDGDDSNQPQFELYENIATFIENFEETKRKKKKKAAKKSKLELFMEDEPPINLDE